MTQQFVDRSIVHDDFSTEAACPFCGTGGSALSHVGIVYDGDQPLSCVCEKCMADGPRQAAYRLCERAWGLYAFVEKPGRSLPSEPWLELTQKVRQRAERWLALAGRFEKM